MIRNQVAYFLTVKAPSEKFNQDKTMEDIEAFIAKSEMVGNVPERDTTDPGYTTLQYDDDKEGGVIDELYKEDIIEALTSLSCKDPELIISVYADNQNCSEDSYWLAAFNGIISESQSILIDARCPDVLTNEASTVVLQAQMTSCQKALVEEFMVALGCQYSFK